MQSMTAESGRWCELVHYVKESMHILATIYSSWYMSILPECCHHRSLASWPLSNVPFLFPFRKSLFQLCFFLSCPRRFWFGGFVKNSRLSKLRSVSSMFSFLGDRWWGLGDIYSLAVLSFGRWLLPPRNNTLGKTETTWVQKFQFISPRVTAVVESATLVNQIVPAKLLNPGRSLWSGVSAESLKPEPTLTQEDT